MGCEGMRSSEMVRWERGEVGSSSSGVEDDIVGVAVGVGGVGVRWSGKVGFTLSLRWSGWMLLRMSHVRKYQRSTSSTPTAEMNVQPRANRADVNTMRNWFRYTDSIHVSDTSLDIYMNYPPYGRLVHLK